jgi:ubiquinone/menaquinone biosynthesis C-methylase UbiE
LLLSPLVKQIVALDFSVKMLAELSKLLDEKEILNVNVRRCDCQAIDEDDREFDLAFSQFGLMFFPDRNAGFAELFRVLKPGGKAAVYSWAPVSESPAMRMVMEAVWAGFPHLRPKDGEQDGLIKGLDDRATFAENLTRAGFEQVNIEPITHLFHAESALAFWQGVVSSSAPVALLKQESTAGAWQAGEARAIAYLEDAIKGPTELASTALLGVGVKPKGKG